MLSCKSESFSISLHDITLAMILCACGSEDKKIEKNIKHHVLKNIILCQRKNLIHYCPYDKQKQAGKTLPFSTLHTPPP